MKVAPPARIPANKVAARECGVNVHALSGKTARAFSRVIFNMKSANCGARLSVLCVALFGAFSVCAQTDSRATLGEVVVVGSRFPESPLDVPSSVQIISRAAIESSAAMSVPEVLRMLGAVNVRSVVGGQLGLNSSVDLGGFGVTATQNTVVVVDGQRLNPIDGSEINWSVLPLSAIERIEIAPAGAGVQFGAGATGGVIFITTDGKPLDRVRARASVGSFGTTQLGFNFDRQFSDSTLSLNAGADHSDGWRDNSQIRGQNLSAKLKKDLGGGASVFGEALLSHSTTGYPGGVLGQVGNGDLRSAKFNNVGSENTAEHGGIRLGGSAALSAHTSLDVDLVAATKTSTLVRPYYDTADSLAGFFASTDEIKLNGRDLSVSPKFRTEYANGASLVYGYDFSQSNQDAVNSYGPLAQQFILANQGPFMYQGNLINDQQSVQLLNHSVYLIARLPLTPLVELSVGARRQVQSFDSNDLNISVGYAQAASGTMAANAHEAGLNFKLSDASRAYLRFDQSYRFANTDEYWGFDQNFNRAFSGKLRPQSTKAYSLGYDFKDARQQVSVVFGQSVTQDEIRYDPAVFQNGNLQDNIARSSLAFQWSQQILDKGQLSMGARFQRADYATGAYSGQTLGMVPTAVYNAAWIQELAGSNKAGLQLAHVSRQNYDASPTVAPTLEQMPAYTTLDIFWARTYGKLDTKLTVKNVTGVNYASYGGYGFVSTPGGSGTTTYYYYPSDPRSLYLSMAYSF
jgi:iron complex outermembrane receptor protein